MDKKIVKSIVAQANIKSEVIKFFNSLDEVTDKKLHEWASQKGYNVHEVETIIYGLAKKFVTFLSNGRANEKGVNKNDVDKKQLEMGINVEKEHTPDVDVAQRISLDHLAELSDYYTRLNKMENEDKKSSIINDILKQASIIDEYKTPQDLVVRVESGKNEYVVNIMSSGFAKSVITVKYFPIGNVVPDLKAEKAATNYAKNLAKALV